MCSIAGVLGLILTSNRALKRMTDALVHRGPDGQGLWESPADERGCGALLGHRRLSILDLSTAASQPMINPSSGDTLVVNGEIYNYVELRSQLERRAYNLHSTGDTAVMLRDPVLVRPTGHEPDAVRRLWEGFLNRSPGLYWSRVWAAYVFTRWCHRHHAYL